MPDRTAVLVHSPQVCAYSYPPQCPFSTRRAHLAYEIISSMRLLSGKGREQVEPKPADEDALLKLHTARYLQVLKEAEAGHLDVEGLEMGLGTEETPIFKGLYDYAALACGGTAAAASLILSGDAHIAFNMSGGYHHAGPQTAAGFCYVNDVAIACSTLTEHGKRVLFLDVDAHHGDGVQNAFYSRSDVMTISFHESGRTLFPGTGFEDEIGVGEGQGFAVNLPLLQGTYDEAFLHAFRAIAPPLVAAYDPDVIVLELGMDMLAGDPLTHLGLTNNAYADVITATMAFDKPIVATGGGGYHEENTARGWALAWSLFCGEDGHDEMSLGLGGVMLGSTDWLGGLRDKRSVTDATQREAVDAAVDKTIEAVKVNVFSFHGL